MLASGDADAAMSALELALAEAACPSPLPVAYTPGTVIYFTLFDFSILFIKG